MVNLFTVISVIGTVGLVLVLALVLGWAYTQTRLPSILAFLIYSIVDPIYGVIANNVIVQRVVSVDNQWLGETVGERVAIYSVVSSLLGRALFTLLLAWMIVELIRWVRRGSERPVAP